MQEWYIATDGASGLFVIIFDKTAGTYRLGHAPFMEPRLSKDIENHGFRIIQRVGAAFGDPNT